MHFKPVKTVLTAALLSVSSAVWALDITGATECYLIHSGGSHLAKGNGTAVLESADAAEAKPLTITPLGDNLYSIAAADGTYLSKKNNWNTDFVADCSSNDAKFRIDDVDGFFIKLRCQGNGKYLGVDNNAPGSSVYSDKDGASANHYWFLSETPDGTAPDIEASYVINPTAGLQTIEGWGVSLCWWANVSGKWSDEAIDELVEWLVSPDGLNYNIFRYNIGGGDDPDNANCTPHHMGNGKGLRAEMEGFKDSSDGEYIWTRDAAQRKIMLKIKEKRPDAIFEAFSNSAPYYMTYSGCCAGNNPSSKDNLKPEYYEEFANYLVDVCKHYKDEYGIEFRTLDPFNEPETSYWGANGGQEGCHFDVASQIAFLKVLAPVLEKSGLSTVISASDETSVAQSVKDFQEYEKAGVLDLVGQWNVHTYTVTDKARAQISALCHSKGLRLWMSETGSGGNGLDGNLGMAQKLLNDVRFIRPAAWVDWQYMEDGNDQWCLVKGNFAEQTYERVKNYYVRSHFSRYIPAGYTILNVFNSQVLAAKSPAGDKLVIVAINREGRPANHTVDLSMYASAGAANGYITSETNEMASLDVTLEGGKLSFAMPAVSIATVVLDVTEAGLPDNSIVDDGKYIIYPRMGKEVALEAADGVVRVANVNYSPAQLWTIAKTGDKYTFTNGNGDIITEVNPNYALTTTQTAGEGQAFSLTAIDAPYYSILTDEGKGFDLEGEKTTNGTGVGVWNYDAASVPAHRQWGILRVSAASSAVEGVAVAEGNVRTVDGGITVDGNCFVNVYTVGGMQIYAGEVDGSLSLPLAAGLYVVKCTDASGCSSVCKAMVK